MALMEIRLAIVRILQRYTLEQDGNVEAIVNKGPVTLAHNLETAKFNLKEKL